METSSGAADRKRITGTSSTDMTTLSDFGGLDALAPAGAAAPQIAFERLSFLALTKADRVEMRPEHDARTETAGPAVSTHTLHATEAVPCHSRLALLEAQYPEWFMEFEMAGGAMCDVPTLKALVRRAPCEQLALWAAGVLHARMLQPL